MKGVVMENSQRNSKSARILDVGRPRARPEDEDTILSFRVSDATIKALDAEAARLTAERGPGASKVSRTEMVKMIIARWMGERPKLRQ
jgi:hypothetical protein